MPIDERYRARVERLRKLAHVLDNSFRVPGTTRRFGLDPLVGLIPGVGDLATALVASYIVFEARRMGVSPGMYLRMTMNVLVDLLVGSVPIVGDLIDFGMKPSERNLRLLEGDLESRTG